MGTPILEEISGSPSGAMIAELAGLSAEPARMAEFELLMQMPGVRDVLDGRAH